MKASIIADTKTPGWSSKNELGLLGSLASFVNTGGTIVEIGSFAGRTASIMARNAPHAKVYCIDPWGDFDIRKVNDNSLSFMSGDLTVFHPGDLFDVFLKNTEDFPNIIPIRGMSTEIEWEADNPVDLLFIDADHDTEPLLQDLKVWWPRMNPKGIIVGHDWQMRSVKLALIEFLEYINSQKVYPQLLNFPTTSIWGMVKGIEHARSWGIDFSGLYPYGDSHWKQQRPLDEVKVQVEEAVKGFLS